MHTVNKLREHSARVYIMYFRNGLGQWEKFTVEDAGGGKLALRGGQQNKLCADEHNNGVKCNRQGFGMRTHNHKINVAVQEWAGAVGKVCRAVLGRLRSSTR